MPLVPILAEFDLTELGELLSATNKRVAENEAKSFRRTSQNWNTQPKFRVVLTGNRGIILDYKVFTDSLIYLFVDEGTKPHKIEPKRAKALRFQPGYSPKTSKGVLVSKGTGQRSGGFVQRDEVVQWTEPRDFTKTILAKADKRWKVAIDTEIKKYVSRKVK